MLVGRFPAELQGHVDFAIGISTDPPDAQAAGRLSEFLMSAVVDVVLAAKGVDRR